MNPSASRLTRRAVAACLAAATLCVSSGAYAEENAPRVKLVTSAGEIVIELYPDKAPKTVANFLQYVRDKHYDGTIFHRVIPNFMIQGGGYDRRYDEKPTRAPVAHEGREALEKGGPRNVLGAVAMARTGDPHSASAQFFINTKDNAFLDPIVIPPGDPVPRFEYQGRVYENVPRDALLRAPQLYGYTVFGKVVNGMDVVRKIESMRTGAGGPFPSDVPRTPVVIKSATVVS
ncbi:peptidylprolyl isomerase [Ramlibacter sp. AW1]|uniref:Peptidyl-prolyl cis-trans isomerase n=1 Tax=Ramlibacter aurantiacus TaxID=2801330 RepID=A0A936ZIJ8_9BURK|nr:peptidylprolyl isomerase [Ramlibacter aurantiacus]MBL0420497.1 peptidylprolyl isomerase [Ramlibacter aurantiacus]